MVCFSNIVCSCLASRTPTRKKGHWKENCGGMFWAKVMTNFCERVDLYVKLSWVNPSIFETDFLQLFARNLWNLSDYKSIRFHCHLICWQTMWLWIWIQLESFKPHISHLFQTVSSLTSRQFQFEDSHSTCMWHDKKDTVNVWNVNSLAGYQSAG